MMPIFQCVTCGCMENTACGYYWGRSATKQCSVCAPSKWDDGSETRWGEWHNLFPRKFFEKGMYETNGQGNLAHKGTGKVVGLEDGFDVKQKDNTPEPPLWIG